MHNLIDDELSSRSTLIRPSLFEECWYDRHVSLGFLANFSTHNLRIRMESSVAVAAWTLPQFNNPFISWHPSGKLIELRYQLLIVCIQFLTEPLFLFYAHLY